MNLKGAVVCSSGIGDGLLFSLLGYHLQKKGFITTVFASPLLKDLQPFFPFFSFIPLPQTPQEIEKIYSSFDRIFIENDNSFRSHFFQKNRKEGVSILFPSYQESKHGILHPNDVVFSSSQSIVSNLEEVAFRFFGVHEKSNGMKMPSHLSYRKENKRVVIHPTSGDPRWSWAKEKYLSLAHQLEKKGFSVVFSLSPSERSSWLDVPFSVPLFPTLQELAVFLYESGYFIGNDSGIGHLASSLGIPTLTIGAKWENLVLWRPDFYVNHLICPPSWIPNIKKLRWRDRYWQKWISPRRVFREFMIFYSQQNR
ncbi:MAG: glycosyltransferase family 9 protein [Chlamydiota bacterium]